MTDGTAFAFTPPPTPSYGTVWYAPPQQRNPERDRAYEALAQLETWEASGYRPQLTSGGGKWVLALCTHDPYSSADGRFAERGGDEHYLRYVTAAYPTPVEAIEAAQEVLQ